MSITGEGHSVGPVAAEHEGQLPQKPALDIAPPVLPLESITALVALGSGVVGYLVRMLQVRFSRPDKVQVKAKDSEEGMFEEIP